MRSNDFTADAIGDFTVGRQPDKFRFALPDARSGDGKSRKGERRNIRQINRVCFESAAAVDEFDSGIGFAELNDRG